MLGGLVESMTFIETSQEKSEGRGAVADDQVERSVLVGVVAAAAWAGDSPDAFPVESGRQLVFPAGLGDVAVKVLHQPRAGGQGGCGVVHIRACRRA